MPQTEKREVERFWVEDPDGNDFEIVITDEFAEYRHRAGAGTQSHFVSLNNRQMRSSDGLPVNINADGTFTLVTTGKILKRTEE